MAIHAPVQPKPIEANWPPPRDQWTYEDYKRLPDDNWRYEVIEGELFMSPAPNTHHQRVIARLQFAMMKHVEAKKLGEVLNAPIDVRLSELANPVQPDILFICRDRLDIIRKDWIEGAPDLIVEVLSPSNWIDDRRTKYRVYALAGVREYWIVDPDKRQIEVFALRGSDYEILGRFGPGEQAGSEVLSGFEISVDEVCPEER
jgi:Uma2 family endonuclease